jgi:metallo-beta-lactamase family protein
VETIHGLSAHADQNEMLRWLGGFTSAPRTTYLVHGEPQSAKALGDLITAKLKWTCQVAQDGQQAPV